DGQNVAYTIFLTNTCLIWAYRSLIGISKITPKPCFAHKIHYPKINSGGDSSVKGRVRSVGEEEEAVKGWGKSNISNKLSITRLY
ncbi:MAG: hypothetical protein LC650_01205, partial [Actinobacteria bacterium]|nr:hypothetical protein [Actinomycetota bacterium]